MPIFTKGRQNILYVHVPKTGGTAIEALFRAHGYVVGHFDGGAGPRSLARVRRCSPQHHTADLLAQLFRLDAFDWVMMTVRNPYARIVSEYNHRRRLDAKLPAFDAWLDDILTRLRENPGLSDNHFRPQGEFYIPGAAIFRQEDGFGAGFIATLHARVGFPADATVPQANAARPEHGGETLLTAETAAAVRAVYWRDFLQFSYDAEQEGKDVLF
jgi:hypothetical protein